MAHLLFMGAAGALGINGIWDYCTDEQKAKLKKLRDEIDSIKLSIQRDSTRFSQIDQDLDHQIIEKQKKIAVRKVELEYQKQETEILDELLRQKEKKEQLILPPQQAPPPQRALLPQED